MSVPLSYPVTVERAWDRIIRDAFAAFTKDRARIMPGRCQGDLARDLKWALTRTEFSDKAQGKQEIGQTIRCERVATGVNTKYTVCFRADRYVDHIVSRKQLVFRHPEEKVEYRSQPVNVGVTRLGGGREQSWTLIPCNRCSIRCYTVHAVIGVAPPFKTRDELHTGMQPPHPRLYSAPNLPTTSALLPPVVGSNLGAAADRSSLHSEEGGRKTTRLGGYSFRIQA